MLATLSPAEGLKALQELRTSMDAGDTCSASSDLADIIRGIWDIKEELAQLASADLDVRFLEWLAKLSTTEALEALQDLKQAAYYLRWQRHIEVHMPQRTVLYSP